MRNSSHKEKLPLQFQETPTLIWISLSATPIQLGAFRTFCMCILKFRLRSHQTHLTSPLSPLPLSKQTQTLSTHTLTYPEFHCKSKYPIFIECARQCPIFTKCAWKHEGNSPSIHIPTLRQSRYSFFTEKLIKVVLHCYSNFHSFIVAQIFMFTFCDRHEIFKLKKLKIIRELLSRNS